MRIASLVPAATEVLFALGLGERVVGVTHECDWPPEVAALSAVTVSRLETGTLGAAEIDRLVASAARRGEPLYAVDEMVWEHIRADVVVAQEVCDVCAVSAGAVRRLDVRVVDYSPTTLDGIASAIARLGRELGADSAGAAIATSMRARIDAVRAAVAGRARPRVFVAEWLDPPYAGGHWVPEMVAAAGGIELAGTAGERSVRTTWETIAAAAPDVVVLAPCGYDVERTLAETPAALPGRSVFAVDANALVSRPGPRVVEGVELLAHLFHPEAWPGPVVPYAVVRAGALSHVGE
jgi:iron complex transport system substrate-binding protein